VNYHGSKKKKLWLEVGGIICAGKYYDLTTPDITRGWIYLIETGFVVRD